MSEDQLYNLIRSKDFDFFDENQKTGNNDLDNLIRICTHRDPN